MSCLPSLSELSLPSKYCLLEDNLEALKWHIEEMQKCLPLKPEALLQLKQHYQEIHQRLVEANHLIHELTKSN